MRRSRLFLTGVLVITAIVVVFGGDIRQAAYRLVTKDMFVDADRDPFDPGPAIGSHFPGLNARYQGNNVKLLSPFAGPRGTVLVALRSVDWCPFCMKQLIQLQQHRAAFDAAGIGLVAITYDTPEAQQRFARDQGISIPLISDIDATTFKTLGILNNDYQPGDDHYGIPFPGMIIVDAQGKVAGKLFVAGYRSRVSAEASANYAIAVLGEDSPSTSTHNQ